MLPTYLKLEDLDPNNPHHQPYINKKHPGTVRTIFQPNKNGPSHKGTYLKYHDTYRVRINENYYRTPLPKHQQLFIKYCKNLEIFTLLFGLALIGIYIFIRTSFFDSFDFMLNESTIIALKAIYFFGVPSIGGIALLSGIKMLDDWECTYSNKCREFEHYNYLKYAQKARDENFIIDSQNIAQRIETDDEFIIRYNRLRSNEQKEFREMYLYASDCMLHDDPQALIDAKINEPDGLNKIIGYPLGELAPGTPPVRIRFEGHGMILAKTGSGKTVHLKTVLKDHTLHPNLHPWYSSCFIYDPGAILWESTSWFQERIKGNRVFLLNASGTDGDFTNFFNPLDLLDPSKEIEFDKLTKRFAERLCPHEGEFGSDPFWAINGQQMVLLMLLHLVEDFPKEERTLAKLFSLCQQLDADYIKKNHLSVHPKNEEIKDLAISIKSNAENAPRMFESFKATATTKLKAFTKKSSLGLITSKSDFDIKDIKGGKISLYVNVSADDLKTMGFWLRFMIELCFDICRNDRRKLPLDDKTVFFIDEFPSLGRIDSVVDSMQQLRQFGVSIIILCQAMSQLKGTYPKSYMTIESACAFIQVFGCEDEEGKDHLSKKTGFTTTRGLNPSESHGTTENTSSSIGESSSVNHSSGKNSSSGSSSSINGSTYSSTSGYSEGISVGNSSNSSRGKSQGTSKTITNNYLVVKRPLKTPNELQNIKKDEQIILISSNYCKRPLEIKKVRFYETPAWQTFRPVFINYDEDDYRIKKQYVKGIEIYDMREDQEKLLQRVEFEIPENPEYSSLTVGASDQNLKSSEPSDAPSQDFVIAQS